MAKELRLALQDVAAPVWTNMRDCMGVSGYEQAAPVSGHVPASPGPCGCAWHSANVPNSHYIPVGAL
eukprot:1548729-Lingulodinium_polyedra.AAC.1